MNPDVSVIMAACNQGDWVRKTVPLAKESLATIPHEIVVVDDQSTDRCCHGLGTDAIVVHTRTRLGVSQSRRLGFDQSRGKVIIWSDPHCEYPDNTLQRLATLAASADAIYQPRTKHQPDKPRSHAGSALAITDRGLVTKPQREAAEHPALYNTIYAVKRDVYEGLGGWPSLPGVWGYSEQALSLMAWVCGVPIVVDEESLGIHYLYQTDQQFPYSVPQSDPAANCHWVHGAFFPETYATFWKPKIDTHFGDASDVGALTLRKPWREFRRWVKVNRIRSERDCFEQLLGIPQPGETPVDFVEQQRPRAEPREHRSAHARVERATTWMLKMIPGCMKGRTVLDVGTRDGYALTRYSAMGARKVHGAEVVPEAAEFAARHTGEAVDVADMRSLPYSNDTWAIVSCIHALEHVPDPEAAIAELARVTSPGGWLFLVVPQEAKARRKYAHNCEFPNVESLVELVGASPMLDAATIKTDVAPYSGEKPEIRLVARKQSPKPTAPPRPTDRKPKSEARYDSRNNPDCKGAALWTSWDGASAEIEVAEMIGGLVRGLQPDGVVETGSAEGRTSRVIGEALKRNGHGLLYAIEIDRQLMKTTRRACRGLPVTAVNADSLEWEPPEELIIDFAFFDSRHSYRAKEFLSMRPNMHKQTIVAFHDTSPRKRTRRYVDQLAEDGWIAPVYLPTPRGIAIARVLK